MSDMERRTILGLRCDKCGFQHRFPREISRWSKEYDVFREAAFADGWSRWVGRSVRDYCPSCVPGPNHKMRLLS